MMSYEEMSKYLKRMIAVEAAAELARNRLLLYLNKTGSKDKLLQSSFDELKKVLKY